MAVPPAIPEAALHAASRDVYERTAVSPHQALQIAKGALGAALPHLLPGMYVTAIDGDSTIWAENPDHPTLPTALLARTDTNRALFDAIAVLLPDRSLDGPCYTGTIAEKEEYRILVVPEGHGPEDALTALERGEDVDWIPARIKAAYDDRDDLWAEAVAVQMTAGGATFLGWVSVY